MKKSLVAMIAVLGAGFMAVQGVEAKTLEDILKEKGVITEADYKEVTNVKPYDYKLGKGFTFTSADEKFSLSVGGRMQYRYTFSDVDAGADSSKFEAKRIRLIFQGHAYSKDLTYKLEIDPVQLAQSGSKGTEAKGGLLDSFINYKVMDELQVLVGQTKVKYGYSLIQSDATLMFIDRVPFIGKMVPSYEIGAYVYGSAAKGLVDYALSVSNGDGQTNAASTNHNAFAGRVMLSPLGKMSSDEPDLAIGKKPLFTIGANYFYNNLNVGESSSAYGTAWNGYGDLQNFGFDTHFKWMGLAVQGEVLFSQGDLKTTDAGMRTMGWYAQTGYMLTPELGLALRYSQFDPNRAVTGDLQTEQIGAVSYYFSKHNLKLQADVANLHNQKGAAAAQDDMQYRVQAQIVF